MHQPVLVAIVAAVLSAYLPVAASGQQSDRGVSVLSNFMGCRNGERVPAGSNPTRGGTPTEDGARTYDWAVADGTADPTIATATPCFARADGVWRPDIEVSLRRDVDVSMWSGDANLSSLAHGMYTQPGLVVLSISPDGNTVTVRDTANTLRSTVYEAEDNTPLTEVMSNRRQSKFYTARGAAGHGDRLELGTTRSGRSELRLGADTYVRPAAQPRFGHCLRGADDGGDSIAAAFLTIENLRAIQRGYDVVFQNPFFLLDNNKSAVFALSDRKCLVERLEVPEGWTMIVEGTQGAMSHQSIVTSQSEHQTITGANFGFGVEIGGGEDEDAGSLRPGVGYSYEHSKNEVKGMQDSDTVGSVIAYSRQKIMALVFNEGEVALSDRFVDLVYRIQRQGADDTQVLDEMIRSFGTHYPYAITFGANARLTRSIERAAYTESLKNDESFKHSASAQGLGVSLNATYGELSGTASSTSDSYETEDSTFVAVNGNGSWNENGYSAGSSPAPILLDLRHLDTLLTPVYFPDEPEIYTRVRARVADHIDAYLRGYQDLISRDSLAPRHPLPHKHMFHFRPAGGETLSLMVCETTEHGFSGYYVLGGDLRDLQEGENPLTRYSAYRMKRETLADGRLSWTGFERDGTFLPTQIEVIEGSAIRVGVYENFFQALDPNKGRVSAASDRLALTLDMEAVGKPCWDVAALKDEVLTEEAKALEDTE
ncbi:MAC/perforin domain-containing protein [Tateyamaria sp. SN3-11]|uniref:MAC/perforin domain-containing protein n=1 Tax=Tateyamaria sp. SN3-11 TaxID=3092147 RepID=UPI0039E7689A